MTRILIVEDESVVREPMAALLQQNGYEVDLADSEASALALARRLPNLILLDVHLGSGASGVSICERMRSIPKLERVPIVMLTADQTREMVMRCLAAGANDYYLKKEFQVDAFLARVRKWAGGAKPPSKGETHEQS